MKTRPSLKSNAVKLIVLAALSTWMFNLGAIAHADESSPPPPPPAKKEGKATGDKKKTNIDFEDELVEGELKKPELFYLLQKKQFNFKRLIKLREDFLPEMRRDADEIRRGRSKN